MCSEYIKLPETVDEALYSEFAEEWWTAMKDGYNALIKTGTWELAKLPTNQRVVFPIKTKKFLSSPLCLKCICLFRLTALSFCALLVRSLDLCFCLCAHSLPHQQCT